MKNNLRLLCVLQIVFFTILLGAGCGHVHYPTNYVLNFPASGPPATPPPDALGALDIREFQCPEYLCEGRIVYRPTPNEIGFYDRHRWATNPRQMITQFVADSPRARTLFKSVSLHDTGVEPAYVLNGTIERLEEVDQGTGIQAVCTISVELLDADTRAIIWSHSASEAVPVQERNVAGVVRSLSVAAQATVDSIVKSLAEMLPSLRTTG